MHPIIQLLNYSKKYKRDIRLATIFSLLNKIFDILPEVLIGFAVDVVVKRQDSLIANYLGVHDPVHQIITLGILTGLIWILESLFEYLYSLRWSFLAQNIQHDLRLDTYSHVQQLSMEYFENKATGNIMSIINDDINQLERFLNDGINQIIQITASTVLISAVFFFISTKIALLSFIPIPIILIGSYILRKKLAERYLNARNQAGDVNNKLNSAISGIVTIKSFTAEKYEINQLSQISEKYGDANKHAVRLSAAITPIIRMAIMGGFLTSLIYGGVLTLNNSIEVAAYSMLIFMSQRLLWPLTYLATVIDNYQRSTASISRVMSILNTPIEIVGGDKLLTNNTKCSIEFNQVDFAYKTTDKIIQNLNLTINAGQTIAFVGKTGSGKSTIIKLLLRFYDIKNGSIKIDNIDIRELNLESLRRHIGLVSQDTFMVNGSILDNIRYGSFDATIEDVINVAKLSHADEFINNLPEGYNTQIGERGQKLSGGQKQRIALARAILKNPSLLILDEATSALDNKTESIVQDALNTVSRDRTTIIIAHRLSTIVNSNMIYVLDKGMIVESGTHHELIKHDGIYASLWQLQLRNPEA